MMQQGIDLQVKPHIVISTPGRLADHLQSCDTFSLRKIKFLVSGGVPFVPFNSKLSNFWQCGTLSSCYGLLCCVNHKYFLLLSTCRFWMKQIVWLRMTLASSWRLYLRSSPKSDRLCCSVLQWQSNLRIYKMLPWINLSSGSKNLSMYSCTCLSVCLLNEDICVYSWTSISRTVIYRIQWMCWSDL